MQSLTSEPLALCETHRLRCSITINIKTLISYCTISNLYKNRQQLNNLILAFSIFFPKTHICHSFHSWPSHFFLKRLSSFSFHRLHRCWEVMTLNIDCHHHDHHRHNHQTPFKSWSLLTFCILAATSTLTLCQWKKAGKKHPILSHNYLHFGFTSLSCIQLTTTSKAYKRRLGGWDCATTQDNKQVSIVYTLAPILQPVWHDKWDGKILFLTHTHTPHPKPNICIIIFGLRCVNSKSYGTWWFRIMINNGHRKHMLFLLDARQKKCTF